MKFYIFGESIGFDRIDHNICSVRTYDMTMLCNTFNDLQHLTFITEYENEFKFNLKVRHIC